MLSARTAALAARLADLHVSSRMVLLARVSGQVAAGSLALSAVLQLALTLQTVGAEPGQLHQVHWLSFVAGGPAHVAALSLLGAATVIGGRRRRALPASPR